MAPLRIFGWHLFGTDTDSYSVHAQRFDDLLSDGFESGDTGRWTAVVP